MKPLSTTSPLENSPSATGILQRVAIGPDGRIGAHQQAIKRIAVVQGQLLERQQMVKIKVQQFKVTLLGSSRSAQRKAWVSSRSLQTGESRHRSAVAGDHHLGFGAGFNGLQQAREVGFGFELDQPRPGRPGAAGRSHGAIAKRSPLGIDGIACTSASPVYGHYS